MRREVIYRSQVYPSVFDVPDIVKFQRVKRNLYRSKGTANTHSDIMAREFRDGRIFLAYQGVNLIPGGDSQFLAERSAEIAMRIGHTGHFTAVDVGTGTGIFATYLEEAIAENPDGQVVATDISAEALTVAERNSQLNGLVKPFKLRQRDVLRGVHAEFGNANLIVCNPPFTPSGRVAHTGFEPVLANDGGSEGVTFYQELLGQSKEMLTSNGVIILQITQINLPRVLACIGSILPNVDIGYVVNPNTERICGLILGNRRIIEQFSTGMIN